MDGNVYAWKTFKDESVVYIWRKIYTPWIIERVFRNNRAAQSLPTAVKEAVQFSYMGAFRSVPCEQLLLPLTLRFVPGPWAHWINVDFVFGSLYSFCLWFCVCLSGLLNR